MEEASSARRCKACSGSWWWLYNTDTIQHDTRVYQHAYGLKGPQPKPEAPGPVHIAPDSTIHKFISTYRPLVQKSHISHLALLSNLTSGLQVAQLLQRDRAAGWVSYGQKRTDYKILSLTYKVIPTTSAFINVICVLLCS